MFEEFLPKPHVPSLIRGNAATPAILQDQAGLERWVEDCLIPGGGFVPGQGGLWLFNQTPKPTMVPDILGVNHMTTIEANVVFGDPGPEIDGEAIRSTYHGGSSSRNKIMAETDTVGLDWNQPWTAAAWVKVGQERSSYIWGNRAGDGFVGLFAATHTNRQHSFSVRRDSEISSSGNVLDASFPFNTWVFMTWCWTGASPVLITRDDVFVGTASMTITLPSGGSQSFGVVSRGNVLSDFSIAMLTVSPGIWSPERIKYLYETAVKGI